MPKVLGVHADCDRRRIALADSGSWGKYASTARWFRGAALFAGMALRHAVGMSTHATPLDEFTREDFDQLSELVLVAWTSAVDQDWSVNAGSLDWSCWETADHAIDCVFSYAFFLATRKLDGYPEFGELHALPGAPPSELILGLRGACNMLSSVIATTPPGTRAIIRRWPEPETAEPNEFAARGAHEMILHAHDFCIGLGVAFEPSHDLCERLYRHSSSWPVWEDHDVCANPWHNLLVRSGRAVPPPSRL